MVFIAYPVIEGCTPLLHKKTSLTFVETLWRQTGTKSIMNLRNFSQKKSVHLLNEVPPPLFLTPGELQHIQAWLAHKLVLSMVSFFTFDCPCSLSSILLNILTRSLEGCISARVAKSKGFFNKWSCNALRHDNSCSFCGSHQLPKLPWDAICNVPLDLF